MARVSAVRQLPLAEWPPQDQAMWERLSAPGSFAKRAGALAHLRPISKIRHIRAYGAWLGWLEATGPDPFKCLEPVQRMSPAALRAYVDAQSRLARRTITNRLESLLRVLSAAYPDHDLGMLAAATNQSRREANREDEERERDPLPAAQDLWAFAQTNFQNAAKLLDGDRSRPVALRDGALFLFHVRHALRLGNLVGLELGRTYEITARGHAVAIPASEAKGNSAIRFAVDPKVANAVATYLEAGRPGFSSGSDPNCPALWLSRKGGALSAHWTGQIVATLAERASGTWVPPQKMRHVAAIAMESAGLSDPYGGSALLAHSDPRTTDRYYYQRSPADALAAYDGLLSGIRRKG